MIDSEPKIIKGRIFVAQLIEDDLFYLNYQPNEHAVAADYQAGYEAYLEITNGRFVKIIIENGEYTTIDNSARLYLQSNKFRFKASAVVMHSIGQRIVYNFYLKFRNQDYPIKAFSSFDKAKEWLNSLNV